MQSAITLSVGRGILYVAIAATAWGTGGAVAAVLYDIGGIGPGAVSFWRFLAGLGMLLAVHAVRRRCRPAATDGSLRRGFARNKRRILITGFGLAVYQTAYFAAVEQAGLALATMVTLGVGPVLVAVGARLLLDERMGLTGTLAVLSSVLGLVLLMGGADGSTGPGPLLGLGYALLSATGYAGVTLLGRASGRRREDGRHEGNQHEGNRQQDSGGGAAESMLLSFAVGTVCLLPLALVEGLLPGTGQLTWTVASIGYLGLVPTALAYTLFFAGLGVVRATTASVIALVEPLTAAAIGIVLLGERLNPVVLTGSVLLLCSVLFLAAAENAGSSPEPAAADGVPPAVRPR